MSHSMSLLLDWCHSLKLFSDPNSGKFVDS